MEKVLIAKNLHKRFSGKPGTTVLKGASLDLRPGESVAIMGKSGEGKSTLLHILGTLDTPTKGSLEICGESVRAGSLSAVRNAHIGFIFQAYHLLEDFTVLENALMPLRIGKKIDGDSVKKAKKLLSDVGLKGKEERLAKHLSGGEKQRLAIARALINDPTLLLADEPTGNLDKDHSDEVQALLLSKAKELGKSLIVVTHDPEFAACCDRLLLLKEGQLYTPS